MTTSTHFAKTPTFANVDQKIGRDAIERYEVLRKEFDAIRAEVNHVLGPAQTVGNGNGPRR